MIIISKLPVFYDWRISRLYADEKHRSYSERITDSVEKKVQHAKDRVIKDHLERTLDKKEERDKRAEDGGVTTSRGILAVLCRFRVRTMAGARESEGDGRV